MHHEKSLVPTLSRPLLITFLITLSLELFKKLLLVWILKSVWTLASYCSDLYLVPILITFCNWNCCSCNHIHSSVNIIHSFTPIRSSLVPFSSVHSFNDRMFCVIADYGRIMWGHCSSLSKIQLKKILYVFTFDWYSVQPGFKELNCRSKIVIVQEVFLRCVLKTTTWYRNKAVRKNYCFKHLANCKGQGGG